ncbi:hypothetical protein HZA57_02455, partial [Candidatus Poribacteria bacterium]|nr:hypothetical protein [Candidatus Poribacteria bacterium]
MNHPLRLEIERLRHQPVELEFSLPPAEFDLTDDPQFRFEQPVTGRFEARMAGNDTVILTGKIATVACCDCVRCLEPL